MILKSIFLTLLILLVSVVGWIVFALGSQSKQVTFSTGSEQGVYYLAGKEIADAFVKSNASVTCKVAFSDGSRENVQRLQNATADVAILQNDAIANENVRSLAMLYTEVLHLVCRRSEGIQCLDDLPGHTTNLGSPSGGTFSVVDELLLFSRVQIPSNQQKHLGFSQAADALRSHDIDAAFFLVGVGAEIIQDLVASPEFELVPIQIRAVADGDGANEVGVSGGSVDYVSQHAFIEGFQTQYPYATYADIPLMSYQGNPTRRTPSVGIGAVLACREGWDSDLAKNLVQTVFEHRAVLGRKTTLLSGLDEQASQTHLQFPLHRGADAFYRRNEPGYLAENAEFIGLLITLAVLLASGLHAVKKWFDQKRKNRVDVYYGQVQAICDSLRQHDFSALEELSLKLNGIESIACEELIDERLDADHSYVILQNMISRCRIEIDRARRGNPVVIRGHDEA